MRVARTAKGYVAKKIDAYSNKLWTQKEVDFIVENYAKMTNREIALQLGRSYDAVRQKITFIKRNGSVVVPPRTKYLALPESKCISCALATPMTCDWLKVNMEDEGQISKALRGREYQTRLDGGVRIYSIQKCPKYIKGKLEVVRFAIK